MIRYDPDMIVTTWNFHPAAIDFALEQLQVRRDVTNEIHGALLSCESSNPIVSWAVYLTIEQFRCTRTVITEKSVPRLILDETPNDRAP